MENLLKEKLKLSKIKRIGNIEESLVADTQVYMADGKQIFVKTSSYKEAAQMFTGEYESLKAIRKTSTVYVPEPLLVVKNFKGKSCIAMEFLELKHLSGQGSALGSELARLHLYNIELMEKEDKNAKFVGRMDEANFVSKFGFDTVTCCGRIPQSNTWCDKWMESFAEKIDTQVKLVQQKFNNRDVGEYWSSLQLKLHTFFEGLDIKPSLLHGDLWNGNAGEHKNRPVIYDPASFYGHHEYDLALASMFGGFPQSFWSTYHKSIPKADGWDSRQDLYMAFNQLNHWNHFGSSYEKQSLDTLKALSK